jgi:hypothetical protein
VALPNIYMRDGLTDMTFFFSAHIFKITLYARGGI